MIIAFTKTREQVRGERHEGAHGQQFRYINQDLGEHVHDPRNLTGEGANWFTVALTVRIGADE